MSASDKVTLTTQVPRDEWREFKREAAALGVSLSAIVRMRPKTGHVAVLLGAAPQITGNQIDVRR